MKPSTVEEYLGQFPAEKQAILRQLRNVLMRVAPEAREMLKWGKPAFEQGTILFVYAAFKNHITFTPTGPALESFKKELSDYSVTKDSVQFPYDQKLPLDLIKRIAGHRLRVVIENDAKWKY